MDFAKVQPAVDNAVFQVVRKYLLFSIVLLPSVDASSFILFLLNYLNESQFV